MLASSSIWSSTVRRGAYPSVTPSYAGGEPVSATGPKWMLNASTGGQFDGGLGDSSVAFVGEIGITGVYQLTKHIALRGGYQTLWISGVALASDNMANATALSSQANITTDGDLFYHGALMSVDFMW